MTKAIMILPEATKRINKIKINLRKKNVQSILKHNHGRTPHGNLHTNPPPSTFFYIPTMIILIYQHFSLLENYVYLIFGFWGFNLCLHANKGGKMKNKSNNK